ncbi:DegT/DnrJ/EryC1/StrS family aminotransferase [Thiorhodovibrio frisius]|uniref:Putative PLP-dependent enzyme possibly involved in cell wall biogenesis n=1 Tax=Thiorhodovibrio frisius TaxID=631362 RepID=H8YY86_9GAMM|nr:DegT/DnrJ/EryC1/StrS family aminotransferase [Thiorhodovibrio frisius]EIC23412.1 putative PLP-dependent enzyme possibly involved in cell wall biogenesis [Thiorhodovibrio frisius]WPL23506.1 UDP-2-acetamido-2-deoxy-3-oxo-D-glucuronate aminotransferase [Thiorhodovibrio frisius]
MNFVDLKTQYERLHEPINRGIQRVLEHGQFVMGPEVLELEQRLADFVGVAHCVSVSSGTDALLAAMMALGIGPGDEVITTPFTFVATAETIALLGAVPVFVDIDPVSYNIAPGAITAAISERTRAIMPVSLYGQCFAVDEVRGIARDAGVAVIEDGAQSFGAASRGRLSCGLSEIGCTSFFPSKPLGCYGDGGACFTDDAELASVLREIRNHGQDRRYHHARLGLNGRLDTMQAAILLAKLDGFGEEVERRTAIGQRYTQGLIAGGAASSRDAEQGLLVPFVPEDQRSVYAQYTLQVDDRDAVIETLSAQGIPTAVHYPIPLNEQPAFASYPVTQDLSVSRRVSRRVLSLPMHPYLGEQDQDRIIASVLAACR